MSESMNGVTKYLAESFDEIFEVTEFHGSSLLSTIFMNGFNDGDVDANGFLGDLGDGGINIAGGAVIGGLRTFMTPLVKLETYK